jgi:hypothetical protein
MGPGIMNRALALCYLSVIDLHWLVVALEHA